ncbi:nitrogen fixation protein FixH [Angulomicrobium tetraedrale]|uniref:Nitrogen fixation protein FixH n=1 Tax=Ancylobacter tetraedralis TaxID=217068 RepID=A0A839ZE23_9HYPH|nr:FixH family protein [Ancylobacter tetraedralis]MBB3773130.1 nitrogen fixation protein FixH [Ancylobacter tetraedralis]
MAAPLSAAPLSIPRVKERPGRPLTGRAVLLYIVAFFGVVFGVNFFMARMAMSTFGGVETDSSYQAGLTYTKENAAAAAQDSLRWKVDAHIEPGRLDIAARDADGRPLTGVTLSAALHHPTDRRFDVTLDPVSLAAGQWRATDQVVAGQWELVLEISRDGERLFRSTNRVVVR